MKYLKLLKKLASLSDHSQHKMSCIITNKNRIVSKGYNKMKTTPRSPHLFNSIHAELAALLNLEYSKSKGCSAYIFRTDKQGKFANAKPCDVCEKVLRNMGIKKIYYTINESWCEEIL